MSVIATAYRHMVAAGMSPEAIAVAIEEMETEMDRKRVARQERNRRYYEKRVLKRLNSDDSDAFKTLSDAERLNSDALRHPSPTSPPKKVPPKPPSKNTPSDTPSLDLPFPNGNGDNQTLSADVFEDFWSAFPKRLGSNPKKPARAKFEAACRHGANPQDLISGAKRLAAQHPVPSEFVPHATTWINQERWKDEATGPPTENVVRFRTVEEIIAEVEALNGGRAKSL